MREIRKLRVGVYTGFYEGPDVSTTPLLCAYGAYIVAETLNQNNQANFESARKAYESENFDLRSTRGWYFVAARQSTDVRPLELGVIFRQTLSKTATSDLIEKVVRGMEGIISRVALSNGADDHLEKLVDGISILRHLFNLSKPHVRLVKLSLIRNLKIIARIYNPSVVVESDEAHNSVRSRQRFSIAVMWLSHWWSTETELIQAHKIAMQRSIRFRAHEM